MKALLVVDMQVQCFMGESPQLDAAGTVRRINALSDVMRKQGSVVYIQHTEPSGGFAPGGNGWQLLPSLAKRPGDPTVAKPACDSFLETELDALLKERGVTDLVITGYATDFCVDATVRTAAALGYKVSVASDGHITRDRPHLSAAKIIEHHNYLWADLILPRERTIRVMPTDVLLSEL